MSREKLLVLRDGSKLGRAITTPGHHFYLAKISCSGRTTHYVGDISKAMRLTRVKWEKLRVQYPSQTKGRLVLAPLNT